MEQAWFEMRDVRRRKFQNAVWIPLRAVQETEELRKFGYAGYLSNFFAAASIAVPIEKRSIADELRWTDVGINHNHAGWVHDDVYKPADVYWAKDGSPLGVHLVLDQRGNLLDHAEWHLHQDFVTTMALKREADSWVRPEEDYIEIARLLRTAKGAPCLLEVRASHLRDYLCARGMALFISSYRSRVEIVEDESHITWPEGRATENVERDRWEGRVTEIHEGGEPYGSEVAVFQAARTDIDPEDDVPLLGPPTDDNMVSESWTFKRTGRRLYRIDGELWRTEWVEPSATSPIVREDKVEPTVFFVVDAEGTKENAETLEDGGRWLWFRPEVISALIDRRGASLSWYTRDTGGVSASPGHAAHFGVNSIGLITVYAKDVALLPEWQQRVWAGYNVPPEGKVSDELLAAQVRVDPARTKAPEAFLARALSRLVDVAKAKTGIQILREHQDLASVVGRAHRFRATDERGLFALAKDLARVTADVIDEKQLQTIVAPPQGTKWGSLKSLEKVLASKIDADEAHSMMGPLFGVYDLRLADAHLSSTEISDSMRLVGIDRSEPFVMQGYRLLDACVGTIYRIAETIDKKW